MKKHGTPRWFIPVVLVIATCSFLLLLARATKGTLCELPQRRIRPMVKRFTGRELPGKAEDLRAIFHSYRGLEQIFVAFQTDQEGCSYILDAFGGQDVLRREFPHVDNNPFGWDISSFRAGCEFQKKLGEVLFDEDLLDRIERDALEHANTGFYPKDAVTGYYLEFNAASKLVFYRVLVFKDQGIVYVFAEKQAQGVHLR